jgi:putative transposase
MMCEVLHVSTSGYYKWLSNQNREPSEREKTRVKLKQKITKIFHENLGTYGSPRIHDDLIKEGYTVSQKTVARLMHEMGLSAVPETKFVVTTDSNHELETYSNDLNREFTVDKPNKVWVADITYIWTLQGWVYLSSVMDLFSRKIVGWKLGTHMKKELTLGALRMAITTRQPEEGLMHHSDRGSQYCSKEYINQLTTCNMHISMSRKGNPYDNACIESFHATLKKDLVYRRRFKTREEAIKAINYYISNFYNGRRKHSTLGYFSPNNFERNYHKSSMDNIS